MSGFYYWIPIERNTNSAALMERMRKDGLAYAIDDRITSRTSDKGPDGNRGVTVCRGKDEDGQLGWWPERQRWKRIPDIDIWCGMFTDAPPKPSELARSEQITGEWITLDDGNKWLAPTARRFVDVDGQLRWTYNLPQRLTLDDGGQWVVGDLKPKYQRLWDMATKYLEAEQDEDGIYRFTLDELNDLAVSGLQVNYYVGAVELDLLGVFDEQSRQRIIAALLDLGTMAEWIKKNVADPDGGTS